ncbi:hypothetical protein QBC47DRAFT_366732 [Echria macrotheca]|uniref:2EXR domain-containing protein n=1 Tax=Echria macrotheca TaxID=438768 RepID=A0AAJ0BLN7_9PEZI|nr:hypothetical protein QBC47DRAFT_366732 [Echria macrotheca]
MTTIPHPADSNGHPEESDEDEMNAVLPDSDDADEHDSDSHDEDVDEDGEEDDEDDDDDDDDLARARQTFFDMEALSESEESEDSYDDHRDCDGMYEEKETYFPQFTRLPMELRLKIWESFCPDLTAQSRVYDFPFNQNRFAEMIFVSQTQAARAVLAVHRESRTFALKSFPDTLEYYLDQPTVGRPTGRLCVLRFRKEKDIILLSNCETGSLRAGGSLCESIPGFTDRICNLAIQPRFFFTQEDIPRPPSDLFPLLKNVFCVVHHSHFSALSLRWCASDQAKYSPVMRFWETEEGVPKQSYEQMYCWPDFEKHRQDCEKEIPLDLMWRVVQLPNYPERNTNADGDEDFDDPRPIPSKEQIAEDVRKQLARLPMWPLVQFDTSGVTRLERLRAWNGKEEDWSESSSFSEDGFYSDDAEAWMDDYYESSGIDDDELAEDATNEDDDDLHVYDDDDSDAQDQSNSLIDFEGLSPLDNGFVAPGEDAGIGNAQFSSPEPESAAETATVDGASEEESDAPVTARRAVNNSRKRVIESDDEEEADEQIPRKRARLANRVQDSDDEEELGDNISRIIVRPIVVDDDSESENLVRPEPGSDGPDSEQDQEDESEQDESESESEEDDESDEDAAPVKRMSLAEKLQLHRRQNPISDDDDDDEDRDSDEPDEYDTRDNGDYQDDEDDEGEDDGDGRGGGAGHSFDFDEMDHEDDGDGEEEEEY